MQSTTSCLFHVVSSQICFGHEYLSFYLIQPHFIATLSGLAFVSLIYTMVSHLFDLLSHKSQRMPSPALFCWPHESPTLLLWFGLFLSHTASSVSYLSVFLMQERDASITLTHTQPIIAYVLPFSLQMSLCLSVAYYIPSYPSIHSHVICVSFRLCLKRQNCVSLLCSFVAGAFDIVESESCSLLCLPLALYCSLFCSLTPSYSVFYPCLSHHWVTVLSLSLLPSCLPSSLVRHDRIC